MPTVMAAGRNLATAGEVVGILVGWLTILKVVWWVKVEVLWVGGGVCVRLERDCRMLCN